MTPWALPTRRRGRATTTSPGLGGRTVEQALADAEDAQTVWRAVHQELGLPARDR